MGFDVTDLLENLFGGPARAAVPGPDDAGGQHVGRVIPCGMATSSTGPEPTGAEPVPAGLQLPLPLDGTALFAYWVRRPDSRGRLGWQSPDSPEVVAWADLQEPGPGCPVCGSLESWVDVLGRERCGLCEAKILDKAMQLAERASKLQTKALGQKTASQEPRGCVPGGRLGSLALRERATVCGNGRGLDYASRQ